MDISRAFKEFVGKILSPDKTEYAPTYDRKLARKINYVAQEITQTNPNKTDLSSLLSLANAYGSKNPSIEQLKTIHNWNIITNKPEISIYFNYRDGYISLCDETAQMFDLASVAGTQLEINHGLLSAASIEKAKCLTGDLPDSDESIPSYENDLDTVIIALKNDHESLFTDIIKKMENASFAICHLAKGKVPDRDKLEDLKKLHQCVSTLAAKILPTKNQANPQEETPLTRTLQNLYIVNNSKNYGPRALTNTIDNLLSYNNSFNNVPNLEQEENQAIASMYIGR
jgi:hypothetical protein